ncbi:hypothetical protein IC614_02835 [Allosphingosinicella flava]|uniref:Uncharacterized protein n=1 Tax=Allosphingosinicella flava TaxID=2771430 RepID=A0A7T2LMG4_9SPHN|nr:hypothetical protein [Sphingosinicella flava]QPQ55554.1 hypothetical protein IC614_02835 [Sphingosinicella flava]
MKNNGLARPSDQALAVPVEPASGLAPTGFDPSRDWPLQARHQRLPKWARLELQAGMCAQISEEMAPDVRGAAKRVFGGNCTFSDDDLAMLEHFAAWAVDQGYRAEISDRRTIKNIARAQALRAMERDSDGSATAERPGTGLDPKDDSAGLEGIAQNQGDQQ